MSQLESRLIQFLNQSVHSIGQLEALLTLHDEKKKRWTTEDLAKMLRTNPTPVQAWLDHFLSTGLVEKVDTQYFFRPSTPELGDNVDLLVREYKVRPLKILEAITSRPTQQMLSFMDAFRIKKGEPDDPS